MERPVSDNVQQQLLIEQRVANESKSQLVAYLLAILLWGFGVHRMYLGRWASGIIMLLMWTLGWLTAPILIGWVPIALVCAWAFIDLFLIPGMIRNDQAVIRQRLMTGRW
ncbi:TM2 domain-containing protein [Paracoccus sp. AK26]|jgi:TM2 domain-containing membrane protein YozV|nr:TM2 domain-containing protein [Paracoccus sp. AK26]